MSAMRESNSGGGPVARRGRRILGASVMAATSVSLCVLSAIYSDRIDLWMRNALPLTTRARSLSGSAASAQDLMAALKAYETEFGVLPESGNASLVKSLSSQTPKGTGYLLFPPDELNTRGEWLDSRNRPWVYERLQDGGYRIYSTGPNGIDEGGQGDDQLFGK